jgi:DNA-binding XRE family transcriptional regulator
MKKEEMKTMGDATTFDELLDIKYGKPGTPERDKFEFRSKSFMIGELLKEVRIQSHMSQDDLAKKSGTKKSYISRVENGKIDIQLSTLYRIFENGLGRQINLTVL